MEAFAYGELITTNFPYCIYYDSIVALFGLYSIRAISWFSSLFPLSFFSFYLFFIKSFYHLFFLVYFIILFCLFQLFGTDSGFFGAIFLPTNLFPLYVMRSSFESVHICSFLRISNEIFFVVLNDG